MLGTPSEVLQSHAGQKPVNTASVAGWTSLRLLGVERSGVRVLIVRSGCRSLKSGIEEHGVQTIRPLLNTVTALDPLQPPDDQPKAHLQAHMCSIYIALM